MLRQFEVALALPEGKYVVSSMGSVLHGMLMEHLSSPLASRLHAEELRPYSQSVYFDRERQQAFWRFGVFDEALYAELADFFAVPRSVELRQKHYTIKLGELKMRKETSFEGLADEVFQRESAPRGITCRFRTATSFKQAGAYQIFPSERLLVQSLLLRWQHFSRDVRLEEENLAEKLAGCCSIRRYRLQSAPFSLEHQVICGFRGELGLVFYGNEMVRRILGLLFSFAPFAGIGIKTALGMGAVEVDWGEK